MSFLTPFPCDNCGMCCCHVNLSLETQFLDRGDGICIAYNQHLKLCRIYDVRPDICRVDEQYIKNYKNKYSWIVKRKVIAYGISNTIDNTEMRCRVRDHSITLGIHLINAFKADLSYDIEKENSTICKNFQSETTPFKQHQA